MTVILLSSDLATISRVEGAARQVGVALRTAADADAAIAFCSQRPIALVIIDLGVASLDVAKLVDQLRAGSQPAPAIVAFGPHVHDALLAAAKAAGCDEVLSRGQFFAQPDAILLRYAGAAE